jgi:hypothetical protein
MPPRPTRTKARAAVRSTARIEGSMDFAVDRDGDGIKSA